MGCYNVAPWRRLLRGRQRKGNMQPSAAHKQNNFACIGRKWLLKCRLRDYGTIQVTAGYGQTKQLPCQQTDVTALNTPTQFINIETAHSRCAAQSFFPQEDRLLGSQFEEPHFCCYDRYFWRRRGTLQTGLETGALDWVWPYVLACNKGLLLAFCNCFPEVFNKKKQL